MSYTVHKGVLSIEGDDGQRIGIGTGGLAARLDVGEAGALYASDTVGINTTNTPGCRFEVRGDGKVGVGVE